MTNDSESDKEEFAKRIVDTFKGVPGAQAVIPANIAANLLEFLRRTQSNGMEAVAWVEAYQFVQQYAPQPAPQPQTQPGVPFGGAPLKP